MDVGQGGGTMAPEISSSPESSAQPLPVGEVHLTLLLRGQVTVQLLPLGPLGFCRIKLPCPGAARPSSVPLNTLLSPLFGLSFQSEGLLFML